jgi:surface protein
MPIISSRLTASRLISNPLTGLTLGEGQSVWSPLAFYGRYDIVAAQMFQDTAGTVPVTTAADPIGRVNSLIAGQPPMLQSTTTARPLYQITPERAVFDATDDALNITIPSGGWSGQFLTGTSLGVVVGKYAVPEGIYRLPTNSLYRLGLSPMTHHYAFNRALTTTEINYYRNLMKANGAGNDVYTSSFVNWFRARTDITELDLTGWDVSGVTTFASFALGCTNVTKIDVSNWTTTGSASFGNFVNACTSLTELNVSSWSTSSVTTFVGFAIGCTSLTTVTVTGGTGNPFADSPCTNYTNAFTNTNLNQASIDAILVAINTAGTSSGTFNQSGGSAPSSTGEAAITAMRSRSWTVTVTGGF